MLKFDTYWPRRTWKTVSLYKVVRGFGSEKALPQQSEFVLGSGQYHHAVAGGFLISMTYLPRIIHPPRYRVVVLTRSNSDS